MGAFLSALGDIFSNESAYRNAAIAAWCCCSRPRASWWPRSRHHQHLDRGDDAGRRIRRRRRPGHGGVCGSGSSSRRPAADRLGRAGEHEPPGCRPTNRGGAGAQCAGARRRRFPRRLERTRLAHRAAMSRFRHLQDPLGRAALFDQPWVLYLVYPVVPAIWFRCIARPGGSKSAPSAKTQRTDVSGLRVKKPAAERSTSRHAGRNRRATSVRAIRALRGLAHRPGARSTSPSPRSSSGAGR